MAKKSGEGLRDKSAEGAAEKPPNGLVTSQSSSSLAYLQPRPLVEGAAIRMLSPYGINFCTFGVDYNYDFPRLSVYPKPPQSRFKPKKSKRRLGKANSVDEGGIDSAGFDGLSRAMATSPHKLQTYTVSQLDGNNFGTERRCSSVEEFVCNRVADESKRRFIKKILVATNGIAAPKCILSIRRVAQNHFGNDRLIKFISLTTEQEIQSNPEYLKMVDGFATSPAGANTNNYANVDEIVRHAVEQKVDAVWAGWGHASENPRLPKELNDHNIVFMGPPSSAMFALGDKIASTIIAQSVNIPTIEWSGSGLVVPSDFDPTSDKIISDDLYREACVESAEEGLQAIREKNITYPVMIKASEGGGGKGIRKCNSDEEFKINFRRVKAEVPGSPIFVMKCMVNARHIEVQLIGDEYGTVIPIFTRDCSMQRRCQKIIEEAPAGIVPREVMKQMQQDAVNLAMKVGYVSAGTVEYMYLPEEEKYYFLELNPRLQVEHPCTEMVADVNIPALQLQVAMGIPLHAVDEIRTFFKLSADQRSLPADVIRTDTDCCVIAARITSEDPAEGFRPASGYIEQLNFNSSRDTWGYFSVVTSGQVHEYADSQFGHLFARGHTRREAVSNLICALKELELRATFQSQVNYLVGLLQDEDFKTNRFHTGWLDERIAAKILMSPELAAHVNLAIGATVIGHARFSEFFSKFRSAIDRGQILPCDLADTWETELVYKNQKYNVLISWYERISFMVYINGSQAHTTVRELSNDQLLITYGGESYTCHFDEEAERYKVTIGKTLAIFEKENDPSILRSRNAGKLLQYTVKDGDKVDVREVYAEMESMKMVIPLEVEKAGGRLIHKARPGQVLFPGTVIALLEDQADMSLLKPVPFNGPLAEWDEAEKNRHLQNEKTGLHIQFKNAINGGEDILAGFALPKDMFLGELNKFLTNLFCILDNRDLPYNLFKAELTASEARLRADMKKEIKSTIAKSKEFPAREVQDIIEEHLQSVDPKDAAVEKTFFEALLKVCERFRDGLKGHKKIVIEELLKKFIQTEKYFQDKSYDLGLSELKKEIADSEEVVRMVYSHTRIDNKAEMLKRILERLDASTILALREPLITISNFFNKECEKISIFVRTLLNQQHIVTVEDKVSQINSKYDSLSQASTCTDIAKHFNANNIEAIQNFLYTDSTEKNTAALAKMAEIISCVKPNQIGPVDVGNCALAMKVSLLSSDPMSRVFVNSGESAANVLYVVAVTDPKGFATAATDLLKAGSNGCAPMFFLISQPEIFSELSVLLENVLPPNDAHRTMVVNAKGAPIFGSVNFFTHYKLELFRLTEQCHSLSRPDSIYHLFAYQKAAVAQVFVRHLLVPNKDSSPDELCSRVVTAIEGACGEMRVFMKTNRSAAQSDCNHIFICIDYGYPQNIDIAVVKNTLRVRCDSMLRKHRVSRVEISYRNVSQKDDHFVRVTYTNETGGVAVVSAYHIDKGVEKDELIPYSNAPHHCYTRNYAFERHTPILQSDVQKKRLIARNIGTTYVYDLPSLFGTATLDMWHNEKRNNPSLYQKKIQLLAEDRIAALDADNGSKFIVAHELILEPSGELTVCRDEAELKRRASNGLNSCGQVAWEMTLFTPDRPQGRVIVVIASDITFRSGSYSMAEHNVYTKSSEYSRKINCPRLFIAASSGARIGLAGQVQKEFHIKWREDKPENGFEYLYLDGESSVRDQVVCSQLEDHLKLDAVIGAENENIGTENLVGSGLTAGETHRAYKEVPTFALVTGRAVGIAAYNARLSKRVCQVGNSPLILTGAPALNSLLGKEVYTSNEQLGGPQIMHPNGVSHAIVNTDAEGIAKIVRWLSYSNPNQDDVVGSCETATRTSVEYCATKSPSDPRAMLDNERGDGIFDEHSFDEIMSGWAKTLVTGRARINGLPVGVITIETRSVEAVIPADPATPDSQAKTIVQAGQVWYPDSAYKTAEAINDFNMEGLPLVILANIRGFSGGQKDMFDMVLKFGAEIVAALQSYVQPVIVYIPPFGELRGGAWAVLDTQINSTCIKMIADPESRGGILEPEGIVEIKYRAAQLEELIAREDKEVQELKQALADASEDAEKQTIQRRLSERVEHLRPMYRPAAVHFADLHDRTPRMLAKGSVHDVVPLESVREYMHRLFVVEMTKISMAKRYLALDGGLKGPVAINDLTTGYEWVEKHLAEKNISYVADGDNDMVMRYRYTVDDLIRYEQSAEFAKVLDGVRFNRTLESVSSYGGESETEERRELAQELAATLTRKLSAAQENELKRFLANLNSL